MHKLDNNFGYLVIVKKDGKSQKSFYYDSIFDVNAKLESLENDGFRTHFFDTLDIEPSFYSVNKNIDVDVWIAEYDR